VLRLFVQECNWLSIRYPQPLHVVLVSRLQLAFWAHFYESTQAVSLHRAPLSIGQTDIAKLCAFWESMSPPQRDAILEGNSPALAFQAENPEQTEVLIRRMVRCPLQWVCHDCGAAASASVARLLERYADSIAEELGTDDGVSTATTAAATKSSHKPKRRKKTRSKQNGKAPHNGALDTNGGDGADDDAPEDAAQEAEASAGSSVPPTAKSPPTSVCEVGPASPRDVSHEGARSFDCWFECLQRTRGSRQNFGCGNINSGHILDGNSAAVVDPGCSDFHGR
jgi:hypothetical protein